jgi:hypothetical protein
VVSLGDWAVSSMWFLLSTGQVTIGTWGNTASLYKVVRFVVFTRQQVCCTTTVTLCGHLSPPTPARCELAPQGVNLPRKVGQFSCEYHPQSLDTSSGFHLNPTWGGWLVTQTLLSAFVPCPNLCSLLVTLSVLLVFPLFTESLVPSSIPILWGRFNIPPHPLLSL